MAKRKLSVLSPLGNAPVYHAVATGSTIDDAKALLEKGAGPGTVVMADFQEKGRGRFPDRTWESPAGENLLFTLILDRPEPFSAVLRLPLIFGLSVAVAIENLFGLKPLLKWPNDVMLERKKTAGILCLTHRHALLVSAGVNCNQRVFPAGPAEEATSITLQAGIPVDREKLLFTLLEAFKGIREDTAWKDAAEKRMFGRGEACRIVREEGGPPSLEGLIAGVGENGELLFRNGSTGRIEKIVSGSLLFTRGAG